MARRSIRFRWKMRAFEQIRRHPAVDARLLAEVSSILSEVGRDHYAGGVEAGKTRSRGYVVTSDAEGIRNESENASLLRALSRRAGGGQA